MLLVAGNTRDVCCGRSFRAFAMERKIVYHPGLGPKPCPSLRLRPTLSSKKALRPSLPFTGKGRRLKSGSSSSCPFAVLRRSAGAHCGWLRAAGCLRNRCSSCYSRYGVSTSSIHFMNARTRRDRLLRCATTRDTASAWRRKSGMISTSAPLSRYRPIPRSGA
jgi:hypothetical protein